MDDWTLRESVTEYETPWYTGGYDRLEQPDGSEKNYYWADLPDAVVVVALDDDDVVMVSQYRPVIDAHCLELVAGIVEDESYEAAARRELREETGYDAESVTLVEEFAVATGVLRHNRGIVVAEGLSESAEGRELDNNEFLTVERVPQANALARARAEQPANDATLEGLLLASADGYLP